MPGSNNVVISGEKQLTIDRSLNNSERSSQILDFLPARRMFNALVRRRLSFGQFLRETRADTALEFALIGMAFFLFIFVIFIFSLDMFWQMTLDDTVRNVTRQVQNGSIANGDDFVKAVCSEFGAAAPGCGPNTVQYSVQTNPSFSAMSLPVLHANGTLSDRDFGTLTATTPQATTNGVVTTQAEPQFLFVKVAFMVPFKLFMLTSGVATENGTPALESAVATVMGPPPPTAPTP